MKKQSQLSLANSESAPASKKLQINKKDNSRYKVKAALQQKEISQSTTRAPNVQGQPDTIMEIEEHKVAQNLSNKNSL